MAGLLTEKKEKTAKENRHIKKAFKKQLRTQRKASRKFEKESFPSEPRKKPSIGAVKNIIIIVLVVALVGESVALIVGKGKNTDTQSEKSGGLSITLNLDTAAIVSDITGELTSTVTSAVSGLADKVMPKLDIMGMVTNIVYSDTIVNLVMSMSYPLLFQTLTDLKMMDFAENVDLYPTPKQLAAHLKGNSYSCCDKNGKRQKLKDVLNTAGESWKYFDTEINTVDKNGKAVKTTIWNTITWGINGKDSFYSALADMTCGLRGVLEVTLQGKRKNVNINLVEFILKKDFANINLEAAQIFNGSGKSGYEECLVPLFTTLGLTASEFPSIKTFCSYENLADVWAAIFESVFAAVRKAVADPVETLPAMLVNFVNSVETGSLIKGMKTLRMDAEYNKLAATVMGFKDGLIFNLGQALVGIIEEMGIKLSGNFNQLLDSLARMLLKDSSADLPDMDINALMACGTAGKDSFGNPLYTADSEKVIDFLINYIIQEKTISLVFDKTEFLTPDEEAKIVAAITESRDGLLNIVNTVIEIVLPKLQKAS